MAQSPTADEVVKAAQELGKDEFTRAELADKLGIQRSDLRDAFKEARQSDRIEKVRDDDEGTGVFRVS